jgi:hypothetical protein
VLRRNRYYALDTGVTPALIEACREHGAEVAEFGIVRSSLPPELRPGGSGGTGRRTSLRSWRPQGHRGSNPFSRTKLLILLRPSGEASGLIWTIRPHFTPQRAGTAETDFHIGPLFAKNAREEIATADWFEPGWTYSDEAYRTFPRYRIAKNIEVEVERIVPYPGTNFGEMRMQLTDACDVSAAQLRSEPNNPIARIALRAEAEEYNLYMQLLQPSDVVFVEALPFRRVISTDEISKVGGDLRPHGTSMVAPGSHLEKDPAPPHLVAFHTDYFKKFEAPQFFARLRGPAVSRVFQLHEFGDPDYEIDLDIFEPHYWNGGEQFSISAKIDWVVYASTNPR